MASHNVRYTDDMPSWFIDAKELWKLLIQRRERNKELSNSYTINLGINQAVGLMNSLPPADVVEVIRCKDCECRGDPVSCPMCFEEEQEWDDDGYTESDWILHDYTTDNGFCYRGVRKDKED